MNASGPDSPANLTPTALPVALLAARDMAIINILVSVIIGPFINVFGLLANTVNLAIFARIGFQDSVGICFFSLSLSDCLMLWIGLFNVVSTILGDFASSISSWFVDPLSLVYLTVVYYSVFLDVSILTTTYISAQRCSCVVFPLQFKGVFTRKRTLVILGCVYTFVVASYCPLMSVRSLRSYTDPTTNATRLVLHLAPWNAEALALYDIFNRMILPVTSQVAVLVCLVVFAVTLRASSQFRKSTTSAVALTRDGWEKDEGDLKSGDRKEEQAVKAVTFIALCFVVCNTPSILISLARRFVVGFDMYQRFHNLYLATVRIKTALEFLNASFNIFVYLKYNSKYREAFFDLLPFLRRTQTK